MSCQEILPCYCHPTSTHLKNSKQAQLRLYKIIFLEAFCEHPKEECTRKDYWRYQLFPHLQQDDNTPAMLVSSLKLQRLKSIAGFSHIKSAVSNLLLFHRAASITNGKKNLYNEGSSLFAASQVHTKSHFLPLPIQKEKQGEENSSF